MLHERSKMTCSQQPVRTGLYIDHNLSLPVPGLLTIFSFLENVSPSAQGAPMAWCSVAAASPRRIVVTLLMSPL